MMDCLSSLNLDFFFFNSMDILVGDMDFWLLLLSIV